MYQEKNQKESLFTNNPNMITFECYEKIGAQMENCICQIDRGDAMGTACFCKIPFPDLEHTLPVLISGSIEPDNTTYGTIPAIYSIKNKPPTAMIIVVKILIIFFTIFIYYINRS